MARTSKAKNEESTALATVDEAAALAELGEFFDEVGVDGLEDFGGEDVKIAVLLWNMRGKGKDGRSLTKDVLFNTVTEDTCESIELVFLTTKKTKRWDSFDKGLDKTVVHCESRDRVTGIMEGGATRACANCPDDGWFTDADGKATRKCGEVHNVVAIERATQKPVAIRFKKTGLKPWRQYASAYHYGGRVVVDPSTGRKVRRNVPLFAYACRLSLKMSDNDMYAIPVLEPIEQGRDDNGNPIYLMSRDEVLAYGQPARDYHEIMGEVLNVADAQTAAHDTDNVERDDAFGADDFVDG
jgi:hypothetical protein